MSRLDDPVIAPSRSDASTLMPAEAVPLDLEPMTPTPAGEVHGYVHGVESCGAVDGPGIRFVVFLTGCPLRCQYCHNPDCMKMKNGSIRSADDVIAEIGTYAGFLKAARGGVTVSGGEPLAQPAFTRAILQGAKDLGLHTAIDTSGFMGKKADETLLDLVDLVLLDIKSGDPETYKITTGVDLAPTIEFASRLAAMGKPMWCRFVLVPGLTDDPDNIAKVAQIIAPLGNTVKRVEILPFHQMAKEKWAEIGLEYKLEQTPPASDEDVAKARAIFAQYGIDAL